MVYSTLTGAEDENLDPSEQKARSFLAKYVAGIGHGFIRGEDGGYALAMPKGDLRIRFVHMKGQVGTGLCIVEWKAHGTETTAFPPWEFHVKDWAMDDPSSERMACLIVWIRKINGLSEGNVRVYSRCREERMAFPLIQGGEFALPIREIISLQAERDWTRLTFGHGSVSNSILVDRSIGKCADDLEPFGFMRVHRGYVINLGCVRDPGQIGSSQQVTLCDGSVRPVARRRSVALLQCLAMIRPGFGHSSET